jgi:predicted GTPase
MVAVPLPKEVIMSIHESNVLSLCAYRERIGKSNILKTLEAQSAASRLKAPAIQAPSIGQRRRLEKMVEIIEQFPDLFADDPNMLQALSTAKATLAR